MKRPTCLAMMVATLTLAPLAVADTEHEPVATDPIVERIASAAALWGDSCAGGTPESCAVVRTIERTNACRPKSHVLSKVARHRGKARKAHSQLARALAELPKDEKSAMTPALAGAVAHARYLVAEGAFEKLATIQSPRGLNFSSSNTKRRKKSEERFLEYFSAMGSETEAVVEAFRAVLAMPDGDQTHAWRVASAARIARTYWLFADQLYTMEIPKDVRTGSYVADATAAFCDALSVQAGPVEEAAHKAAAMCTALSDESKSRWHAECVAMEAPIVGGP